MGQFKPMVKMETTEPSIELKLKKGGKVEKKMQMGGSPDMAAPAAPSMPARGGMMPPATPMRPSLAARRRAMRAMPSGAAPAAPVGMAGRMMKEGGESKAEHKAEMAKMSKTAQALKEHAGKPASKAHKGLKTGGVVMGAAGYKHGGIINTEGQGGEYRNTKMHDGGKEHATPKKTGEVVKGKPGGYATGGVAKANAGGYKRGGKIKKMADGGILGPGLMTGTVEAPGKSSSAYGGLEQIRGGAQGLEGALSSISSAVGSPKTGGSPYRKGGAAKKAFATGGVVNSGAPVAMPQGRKKPSAPVSITALSGTFKKGGKVTAAEGRLHKNFEKENATAMKEAKAYSNEVYSKYGKKMAGGGVPSAVRDQRQTEENQRAHANWERSQTQENEAMRNAVLGFPRKVMKGIKGLFSSDAPKGSVTETEKSVTVTPAKKRGGAVTC